MPPAQADSANVVADLAQQPRPPGPATAPARSPQPRGARLLPGHAPLRAAGPGAWVAPWSRVPGLGSRLNPLDAGAPGQDLPADVEQLRERLGEIHRRRLTLLSSLVTTWLGRPLDPTEEAALSLAIRHAPGEAGGATALIDPTTPHVWQLLRDPASEMARELRIRQGWTSCGT